MMRPSRPYAGALRSSSGAFDLPSIITGVVVVGILAAGILAAIFGVIPFVQNNAAKQDLMAVNTAQGVTYAKDGQKYRDLAGLEDAGLVSLDAEKMEVTTSNEGKGFRAVATSGTGQKWFITHENSVPQELKEEETPAAAEVNWTGQWCSLEGPVGTTTKRLYEAVTDPGYLEMLKMGWGAPADMDAAMAFMDRHPVLWDPISLEGEEAAALDEVHSLMGNAEIAAMAHLRDIPGTDEEWGYLRSRIQEEHTSAFKEFCGTYAGQRPVIDEHPSRPDTWYPNIHGTTGSQEPMVLGFTLSYAYGDRSVDGDNFTITPRGAENIPGYGSSSTRLETVDGKPYWTVELNPGASGWGDSEAEYAVTIAVHPAGAAPDSSARTADWTAKVNPAALKMVSRDWPSNEYGDSWDNVVRHLGSESLYAQLSVLKTDYPGAPAADITHEGAQAVSQYIVEQSGDMKINRFWENTTFLVEPYPDGFGIGTATIRKTVVDPITFARDTHDFRLTITDGSDVPAPVLELKDSPQYEGDLSQVVSVDNAYYKYDYEAEVTYEGVTIPGGYGTVELGHPDRKLIVYAMQTGEPGAGFRLDWLISDWAPSDVERPPLAAKAELNVTYKPTGKSTTIQVPVKAW